MKVNNKTELFISASSMPGNFGMTIYNELFESYKLNNLYIGRKVENAKLLIEALRVFQVKGCSVSMPLKNQVFEHIDELSAEAAATQSVNTIVRSGERLIGFNTDIIGFEKALNNKKIQSAVVYGTGSVADSVIFELLNSNINIYISGRNKDHVKQKAQKWGVNIYSDQSSYDIFISATPIGHNPINNDIEVILKNGSCVFDLVVKKDTYLEKYSKQTGKDFISGFEMYKHQFCKQFELYTGIEISPDIVENIAENNNLI